MNNKPLISVVMPVYNESIQELHDSIKSILSQTYKHFEFIIIDDNPKDINIKDYIKKKSFHDNRIKLIFNEYNMGLVKSENKGIKISSGKYVARMDADDIAVKDRLKLQLQFIINNRLDIVSSNFSIIDNNNKITRKQSFSKITQINQDKIKNAMAHFSLVIGPTLFFSKRLFTRINGYRQTCVDDYDFASRALILGFRLGYQSKSLIFKRLRKSSISYNRLLQQYVIIRTISKWLYKYNYSKILPLTLLNNSINIISDKELTHFHRYADARYTFNGNKNIINLIYVIMSVISSKIVFKRCLWSIFINKNQDIFLK